MQCPVCLKEFKNHNSYRVHRWRFHNPNTTYGQKTSDSTPSTETYPSPSEAYEPSLVPAVAAASMGAVAIAGNNWKRWLILIVIIAGLAFLVWYFILRKAGDENADN